MAGMLPGVECARRRRVWQSSSGGGATEGAGAARRPSRSLCLYVGGGRGRDLCSSSSSPAAAASPKAWSGACGATTAAMGSGAREAKERLDHKLRGQRQPVVLKRHEMSTGATCSGTIHRHPSPAKPHDDAACSGIHRHHSATTAPCGVLLQREVLPSTPNKKGGGGGRRFGWYRRLAGVQSEPPEAECAVCLEELRAGDVVARLPCAHRFHWSCAVPWVQAVSRCPVCRAHARVGPA